MKHLMIDIETLDTKPTSVIVSAAGLLFDPITREQKECFSLMFDVPTQIALGRTMSIDTVAWWMQQSYEARAKAFASPVCSELDDIRNGITAILADRTIEHIWANDPDFDCTILRDFMGYDYKWPFYKHRSMRTIKAMFPQRYNGIAGAPPSPVESGTWVAHDPMDDCKQQAWHVMNCWPDFSTP